MNKNHFHHHQPSTIHLLSQAIKYQRQWNMQAPTESDNLASLENLQLPAKGCWYGLNYVPPKIHMLNSSLPVSQNVTLLGDSLYTSNEVKIRSGWALIQYDWCPFTNGKFGHKHIQKGDNVKTQGEDTKM